MAAEYCRLRGEIRLLRLVRPLKFLIMALLMKHSCRTPLRRLLPSIALLAAAAFSTADLKVVSQMQMSMNGDFRPVEYSTTYYKGDWIRVDSKNRTMLSNRKLHKMIQIDHIHKTYTVTNEDIGDRAAEMMKMMGGQVHATVTPTEEHKEIAKLQATKYLADFDFDMHLPQAAGKAVHLKLHMENWTTMDLPIQTDAGASMGDPTDMIQSLMALTGIDQVKDELSKIKGFPLEEKISTTIDAPEIPAPVSLEMTHQVISTSTATINQAMFQIPAEYKEAGYAEDEDLGWRSAEDGG